MVIGVKKAKRKVRNSRTEARTGIEQRQRYPAGMDSIERRKGL